MSRTPVVVSVLAAFVLGGVAGRLLGTVNSDGAAHPAPPIAHLFEPDKAQASVATLASVPETATTTLNVRDQLQVIARTASEFDQSARLYALMSSMDAGAVIELIEDARDILKNRDYVAGSAIMYGRLAELDPTGAIDYALSSNSSAKIDWIRSIFHALARLNVDQAVELIATLPAGFRSVASQALLRSRDDLPYSKRQHIAQQLGTQVPAEVTGGDLHQAWSNALQHPNRQARLRGLANASAQLAMSDPLAAMNLISELNELNDRRILQRQVIQIWTRTEPEGAIEWLLEHPTQTNNQLLASVLGAYAQSDAQAAMQIAESLNGNNRISAMTNVLGPWTRQNTEAALAWLNQQTDSQLRQRSIPTIASSLAAEDFSRVEQWLDALEPEESRLAETYVMLNLGRGNPDAAARQIERIDDNDRRTNMANSLVGQWAREDGNATAQWIEQLSIEDKGALYQQLTQSWVQSDPEKAVRFARNMYRGDERDKALFGAINGAYSDVDLMQKIFSEISDPDLKQQAATSVYFRMLSQDSDRAEAFRLENGLEEYNGRRSTGLRSLGQ